MRVRAHALVAGLTPGEEGELDDTIGAQLIAGGYATEINETKAPSAAHRRATEAAEKIAAPPLESEPQEGGG